MGYTKLQAAAAWALAERQHAVIARWQLLELGYSSQAIKHRLARRRLHRLWRGVYAICSPAVLPREGWWMAAVLICGHDAALSHASAGELWGIVAPMATGTHVSVAADVRRCQPGIVVHRRVALDSVVRDRIPVTPIVVTLTDLATCLPSYRLERAISEADRLDLIDPDALRSSLDSCARRPGLGVLRRTLDRRTFRLTDSRLEQLFLPLAAAAGLAPPQTGTRLNGFKVDFFWPELGLVVETDGLRYHRTPAEQAHDRIRDQTHMAAGLTPVRFTHAQVRFDSAYVRRTLATIAQRLSTDGYRAAGARRGATR